MPYHTVIISPHLDDGVFSCGDLLASSPGSLVLTVFAGGPPASAEIKIWDQRAGFAQNDDVITLRRAEDTAALARLGAEPYWLNFWDSQYGRPPSTKEIETSIEQVLLDLSPSFVFFPLGLYHSDHILTHNACLVLAKRLTFSWFLYEDAIYRRYQDHSPDSALERLYAAGISLRTTQFSTETASENKRAAVDCYQSQIRALKATPGHPGPDDIYGREHYWELL